MGQTSALGLFCGMHFVVAVLLKDLLVLHGLARVPRLHRGLV